MSGWDDGQVFVSNQSGALAATGSEDANIYGFIERFKEFVRNFREDNSFIYRDQLRQNCVLGNYSLRVSLEHLSAFDRSTDLASRLKDEPVQLIPKVQNALAEVALSLVATENGIDLNIPNEIQLILESEQKTIAIRNLLSSHISKIVAVSGIVISSSRVQAKATSLALMCRNCHARVNLKCQPGFGGANLPKTCQSADGSATAGEVKKFRDKCPPDPYVILSDSSTYSDHQTLKLQEDPETIPTGEMPRQILLSVEREMVGKAAPGTRVTVLGIYTILQSQKQRSGGGSGIHQAYVRVLGIRSEGSGRFVSRFTPEEEAEFALLSRKPQLYDFLADNIAPSIYGHADIKKALLCQLFGGARKLLPDGMRLRGDINVLLLGDPGTAKSQMLKFIEKLSPIAVYTSGKGSSAAGLTASVVKDKGTREFYLEGGAMVLADGGIVCIDEFDKMRLQDRVAIHEAMEQQTISIAKAGITTILNSRTSVLAAANPAFGRYDEMRSASDNIDFQTTILSRFDLIFIVKDILNEETDKKIARHVLRLHSRQRGPADDTDSESELSLLQFKRYIAYCKAKCSPRLSAAAADVLKNHYVNIRSDVRSRENDGSQSTIPITVRQLEAIVRISESLAKMSLSTVATEQHVNEAIRLFKVSTYEAATSGAVVTETLNPQVMKEVTGAEQSIKRRLPIGSQISEKQVVEDFVKQGMSEFAIRKAIQIMVQREELEYRAQRKRIYRIC
eukprot:TRINITY_DN8362_c0_g1_i1.p1 TRINITY_DN8362_c0_g1~~TRINITY_DN8362_c0_g1_i1.p1  ORF type:complete len:734 (+),score=182.09 TRINITY_DN8362_c0_g1_i1:65-2266(+)